MHDASQVALSPAVPIAGSLLVVGSMAVWLAVAWRLRRGLPVLPYESRRAAPWRGLDVLALFVVLELVGPLLILPLFDLLTGREAGGPTATDSAAPVDVQHPIVDLLRADPSVGTWLLCGLVAVLAAPVIEEFMYRLLLQGWLEAEERRARRRIPALRRLIPGVGPIVLVSVLFALRHFRWAAPPMEPDKLKEAMLFQAAWSLLMFGFGVWLLRSRTGATAVDLGVVPGKLLADVRLGLLAFAAVGAPVILLQYVISRFVAPSYVAADPIPLLVLALVLGTIYYRTHRIVPAIVLHMALNGTSLALAWFYLQPSS